ncbi:MAG: GWxTD domain-containing protein [Bacteroidota bacterium]
MKLRSFVAVFLIILMSFSLKALDANVTYATFKGVEQDNYIEVYLQVIGRSIEFVETDEGFGAAVEVTLMFMQDETIAAVDKYVLQSPVYKIDLSSEVSLVDMKRMSLPNGTYTLEVKLKDMNRDDNTRTYTTVVNMDYGRQAACISDIQLIEDFASSEEAGKYVKNGLFLKPYTYTMYPSFVDQLTFYAEVYNTDADLGKDFLVKFFLREKGQADKPIPGMMGIRKQSPQEVNTVLMQMNIADVPTGDYDLVVEIRDQQNELVCSKALSVKRSNPEKFDYTEFDQYDIQNSFVTDLSEEELYLAVDALGPIIDDIGVPTLVEVQKSDDLDDDRQFLHHFWSKYNELEPVVLYEKYMKKVHLVNQKFSTAFDDGYETDRGYIFLKYGSPNDIYEREREPAASPYEIWKYYSLNKNQRNGSFIFYNPSLAPGNYVLLHSNVRGELQDPQWERKLYENTLPGTPKEEWDGANVMQHHGGGEARAYFEQY